jgi:hypothetical protein
MSYVSQRLETILAITFILASVYRTFMFQRDVVVRVIGPSPHNCLGL